MLSSRKYLPLLLGLVLGMPLAQAAKDPDLKAGDYLQFAPTIGAALYSGYLGDSQGEWQLAKQTAFTIVATSALKAAFNHTSLGERPEGGKDSFPSGHTSFACSGAAYLGERYGWQAAAPAYAIAGFVAYVRVDERKHHWRDVIAGCALAYGGSKWLVTPQNEQKLSIEPLVMDKGGVGLNVRYDW